MYENEITMCSIEIACDTGIVAYHKSFQHKGYIIIFNQKQAHMDRLSFEYCYLINLFNVSVEKFVSNSPSTPGESKRIQIRNKLKNY